ncbi:MAG: ABC transporter substrate-binding protein [Bacillota bacterium]|nr:ABC transporter substrate-binding protein [Bacillota bacterium]
MRIVSLQPSISIILEKLGRLDTLIACTRYCLAAVPGLRQRNPVVVHDSWTAATDELTALSPDLVMASVPYRQESLAAILKAGFPVLSFSPHTLADIYNDIRLIAAVVDAKFQGEVLIGEMQSTMEKVRRQAALAATSPLVYCEEWGKPLIHSQPWVKELVEIAGGQFLGAPGKTTNAETVVSADPDVIVMAWCGAGDRVPLERVVRQRGWQDLKAVRQGRVYCIADEWLNTPAPVLKNGLRALASVLHPEVFGDIEEQMGRRIGISLNNA